MNIDQANAISMTFFLKQLGFLPARETEYSATYLSPLRKERTASFHVSKKKNRWFDHGNEEGGDLVSFVCKYLKYRKEDDKVPDALRYIKNMSGLSPLIAVISGHEKDEEPGLIFKSAAALDHKALLNYLTSRGIDLHYAMSWLEKVKVVNPSSGKTITSLGFKNDNDGYELRNRQFKSCVGSKYITFIPGSDPETQGVHIFEGFMDYLTILTIKNTFRLKEDVIVLNSLSNLGKATPYINEDRHKVAYTWMDNDVAGKKADAKISDFLKNVGIRLRAMNDVYKNRKDVNEWHMRNLNLTL